MTGLDDNGRRLEVERIAFTEELYHYMRKKDMETQTELMHTIKSIIYKKIK